MSWTVAYVRRKLTAVMVSIHRTNGSEVRYLESELAYSFHICPKMSVAGAMRVWL